MADANWRSRQAPGATTPRQPQPQQHGYYGDHPAAHPHQAAQHAAQQPGGRVVRSEPPMHGHAGQSGQAHTGYGAQAPLDPAHHGYGAQPQSPQHAHPAHHDTARAGYAPPPQGFQPHQQPQVQQHPHAQPPQAQWQQPTLGTAHRPQATPPRGAQYATPPQHAGAHYAPPPPEMTYADGAGGVGRAFNGAGALLSLALIGGLAVWGYNLAMRDVTEVPVVAALEGAMRVAPENPGGQAAANQGLAVNSVAGGGTSDELAEQVLLAPPAEELGPEDTPAVSEAMLDATPGAEAGEFRPEDELAATQVSGDDAEAARAEALAIAEEIANGEEPLSTGADEPAEAETAEATEPVTGPGVKASPRPRARPSDLVARAASQPSSDALLAATQAATNEVDAADIPSGTRLVQLGAYDTEDVARAEWDQLAGRFDEYLSGKSRVIEVAQSGGKTFYRLRAMGFDDLSDARRFCAALMAGQAACIPVVTR